MSDAGLWLGLVALGAYHGANPAMGWLFAVSQGLQHESRGALLRALGPIALGHELSIALVAVLVTVAGALVDSDTLRIGAAAALLAFGIFRFAKPRAHWRWTTMRVSSRELTLWSFLMSTAHGAGLIVAPVLIGLQGHDAHNHEATHADMLADGSLLASGAGIAMHVTAMLVVMGATALFVYDKLGLEILRRGWINTDQLWAAAFIWAALITLIS